MHTLTLMRHAKSSWDAPQLSDPDRPLNARGEKAAKLMARRIEKTGYRPDLLLVSPALRTRQTAEALQKRFGNTLKTQIEPTLYEAGIKTYIETICTIDESVNALMIIGHNPTLEILVETLGGRYRKMPTAAYICFQIPTSWKAFGMKAYEVLAYDYPKSDR